MSHTYTSQAMAKQNGLAMGHRYWFGIPIAAPNLPFPLSSLPAGSLISTSEDMARYLIAHLNGGRYGDVAGPLQRRHRRVAPRGGGTTGDGYSVAAYGMGWFVNKIGRTTFVSHAGNVPDFSAYMALLPEQKKGVVLLVNADHHGFRSS